MSEPFTMQVIQKAIERHSEWRSLDFFEPSREAIVAAIVEKLKIPASEFVLSNDTASFHYLTTVLAIADWVRKSGFAELKLKHEKEEGGLRNNELLARSKLVAGALIRLFLHPYVLGVEGMQGADAFVQGFCGASGIDQNMTVIVLAAADHVRGATIKLAWHLANPDKEPGFHPVTTDFFNNYHDLLADNDGDELMPPAAAMDAALQLGAALDFLVDRSDRLPAPPSMMSAEGNDAKTHNNLRNYLMLGGLFRKPMVLLNDKLKTDGADFYKAANGLSKKKPPVLMDSVFEDEGRISICVPLITQDGSDDTMLLVGRAAKAVSDAKVSVMMYPVL